MSTKQCVPKPELQRFLRGDLDEQSFAVVAAHVDTCDPCQNTVVAMSDQSDTFIAAMKSAGAVAPEGTENALKLGLERVFTSLRNKTSESQSKTLPDEQYQIGPYLVKEQLGSGGMGHVYRAKHIKLKRDVALKVLSTNRWVNASAVTRFEREMEAIGQLDHPHIVRATDAGEENGMHYLVMEFVDGLDLARMVNRLGPLPIAETCELARQCATGLQHAHDSGLVHRDIKPSNLMLARDKSTERNGSSEPILKILDLGLALLGDEHLQEGHEITTVGTLMGTLDYMSPEQGIDSHGVDHRTDVYSLGATLFKLLTGQAPYADPQYATRMRKMTALATKDAPSIGSVRTDLPDELVKVIDRMLSRDPDQRYQTTEDVAEALQPFAVRADLTNLLRKGLATEDPVENATPHVPVPALLTNGPKVSPQPAASDKSGRWRNRWLIAFAAGFVALAASVIFRMATDFGELVIMSDDPNAVVLVKKRTGQIAKELKIENGKGGLRLWAGEYELEVKGDASVQINPPSVKIARSTTSSAAIGSASGLNLNEPVVSSPVDNPQIELPSVADFATVQQPLRSASYYNEKSAEIKDLIDQIKTSRAEYKNVQPRINSLQKTRREVNEINEKIKELEDKTAEVNNGILLAGDKPHVQEYTVNIPYTEMVDGKPVTKLRQETRLRTLRTNSRITESKKQMLVSLGLDRKSQEEKLTKLLADRRLSSIEELDNKLQQAKTKKQTAGEKLNAAKLAFHENLELLRKDRLDDPGYGGQIIRPHSRLKIKAQLFSWSNPSIDDIFGLEVSGAVHLGPKVGRVIVVGMTYEEAEQAISNMLHTKFKGTHFWLGGVMVTDPPG